MVILKYVLYVAIVITTCFIIKDIVKIIKLIKDGKKNGRD